MDAKLVGWGRAVKARRRAAWPPLGPPLWLFTDRERVPDLLSVVRQLPRGLCGVVFRHDGVAGRAEMLQSVWRTCRSCRIPLVVAGGGAVPWGVGRHRRAGRGARSTYLSTASAHSVPDLVRAGRSGAALVFLSPAFPTDSHPGQPALGAARWRLAARRARIAVAALGGVTGATVRSLGRGVRAVGAIGAFMPD